MATAPEIAQESENLRRFTAEEFRLMADSGLFRDEERLEFHDGLIYEKEAGSIVRRRFTTEEYHRLGDLDILHGDEHLELMDGEIFVMSPIDSSHSGCVIFLNRSLTIGLGARATVSPQNPLRLVDGSEPEPDLCLLRPRQDDYRTGHPLPEDVLLAIEVMNTSASYDRKKKLPAYAATGVPEVWLVDLNSDRVECHRTPRDGAFSDTRTLRRGELISPEAFPDVVIPIDDILG